MTEPDLTPFQEANEAGRKRWADRQSLIAEHFPSTAQPNIGEMLCRDDRILGAILRDVLHSIQTPDGKRGRKAAFDTEQAQEDLTTIEGANYTRYPFHEAFRQLARERRTGRNHSLTEIARRTSISRSRVYRLLNRVEPPSVEDLALIARAYGKPESYFGEYRARFVAQHLASALERDPDMSQTVFEQITGGAR